jgi:PHP family Zn ribbon phosphoesterase
MRVPKGFDLPEGRGVNLEMLANANGVGVRLQVPREEERDRSKYRSERVTILGETFDSKKEARYYFETLKPLAEAGVIRNLQRQVPYELHCPGGHVVSRYVADFVYERPDSEPRRKARRPRKGKFLPVAENVVWRTVIADAKGVRTRLYKLKRKWLKLEYGLVIEEV